MRYLLLFIFIVTLAVCRPANAVSADEKLSQAETDSLHQLEEAIERTPKDGNLWVRLGYAYFSAGDMKQAEKSFRNGMRYANSAAAYNGMGLVFMYSKTHHKYNALQYFRRALGIDPTYIEAQINLAQLYIDLKNDSAEKALMKIIAMDSTYTPAYLQLGKWHDKMGLNQEKAAYYYDRYLAFASDDVEGNKLSAEFYLRLGNYAKVAETLEGFVTRHPTEVKVFPILAYAYVKLGKIAPAERYFERYLDSLDPDVRTLYEDIRFVASRDELAVFNATPIDEREGFLRRFWNLHDPDITTAENERRVEHYWRVWYALHHFSEDQSLWDRRGEVYIRFGEPDYRSRSDELNFEQSMAVQRIKERLALSLYGTKVHPKEFLRSGGPRSNNLYDLAEPIIAPLGATYVGPVYPVRSLRGKISEFQGYTAKTFHTATGSARESRTDVFRPVTASENGAMVAWENWIYVDIGAGLDIAFTDERGRGVYDYAPAPPGDMVPLRQLAMLHRYNPRTVTEQAAALIPDYYRPLENEDPSEFYFASADFRGEDENTMCEVYLGVPHTLGYYFATQDETRLSVERTIALINTGTGSIYRSRAPLIFRNAGDVTQLKGAVVPDVIRLDVPPGTYKMEVSVQDLISIGKGRYRQDMEIEAYPQTQLRVSDLELAWQISEKKEIGKFSKGHLEVIPMPTRTFPRDRSIYVYYEIYNLKHNAFGQTRYRVVYTIRSQEKMTLGALVSQLVKTITKGKDEEIAIDFEQVGKGASEAAYVALDLTACGLGRHTVSVEITDLESGEKAVKEATFVVAE